MTLLTLSASDLRARLLGRGMLLARPTLGDAARRIEAVNPAVNAVIAVEPDLARQAAEESDRRIAAGEARPLEGLVITIKDSFDVAGLRSTAGASPFQIE